MNKHEIISGSHNQNTDESPPQNEIKPTNIAAFIEGIQCPVTKSFFLAESPEY